jgi:hypothetical protein
MWESSVFIKKANSTCTFLTYLMHIQNWIYLEYGTEIHLVNDKSYLYRISYKIPLRKGQLIGIPYNSMKTSYETKENIPNS